MPNWIVSRQLKQKMVYWPPADILGTVATDEYGKQYFGDAVEITCRCETNLRSIMGADGLVLKAGSDVYSDRLLAERGYLMLGSLDELTPTDPGSDERCLQIITVEIVPAVRNDQSSYVARV